MKKLIELPIIRYPNSVAQPAYETIAVVNDLLEAFEQHKKTDAHKKAINNSKDRWARANRD